MWLRTRGCQDPALPVSLLSPLHKAQEDFVTKNNSQKGERRCHCLMKSWLVSDNPQQRASSSVKLGNSTLFRLLPQASPKTLISACVSYCTLAGCLIKKHNKHHSQCVHNFFDFVAIQCVHLNL